MAVNGHLHEQLQKLFREKLHLDVPADDTDLVDTGLIDSLQFVQLIVHLEEDFGLQVSMEDLNIDHFRSLATIAAFLRSHGQASPNRHGPDARPGAESGRT